MPVSAALIPTKYPFSLKKMLLQELNLCNSFRDGFRKIEEIISEVPNSPNGFKTSFGTEFELCLNDKYAPKSLKHVCTLLQTAFVALEEPIVEENMFHDLDDTKQQDALHFIHFCLGMVDWYSETTERPVHSPLIILEALHGQLLQISSETHLTLQDQIAKSCESWFIADLPGKTSIVPQAVSFLMMRSIGPAAKVADIKRAYLMRTGLELFDYSDESSSSLKELILFAFITPSYIKSVDGRKFLAYLACFSEVLIPEIHATIKNQLATASKGLVTSYADVYFRAWKLAQGPCIAKIEYICIQDIINHALHASKGGPKPTPATKLFLIMEKFHSNKKIAGVDEMLYRLYSQLLWKALNATNPLVRSNACKLFVDAFPLRNSEESGADFDSLMQKQFETLSYLLHDPFPEIRAIAVQGICRIFGVYWEMIPTKTLNENLTLLSTELAYDANAPEVRQSVLDGLGYMLQNCPLCHSALRRHLLNVGKLVHDGCLKNRIAFMDLMLAIEQIPDIKFWEVVELPHLLYRLEVDQPAVAKRIVSLLLKSFFPERKDLNTKITRMSIMMEKNIHATRRFFYYLPKYCRLDTVLDFIIGLYQCLHYFDKKSKPKGHKGSLVSVTAESYGIIEKKFDLILDEISILLDRTVPIISEEGKEKYRQMAVDCFEAHSINSLLPNCKSSIGVIALYKIASHALSSDVAEFSDKFQELLVEGYQVKEEQACVIDCYCEWGLGKSVIDLIEMLLGQFIQLYHQQTIQSENDTKDQESPLIVMEIPECVKLALGYLKIILTETEKKSTILESIESMNELVSHLAEFSESLVKLRQSSNIMWNDECDDLSQSLYEIIKLVAQ